MQKISVVIPVYNEEKTIENIIRKVHDAPDLGLSKEIIVVNDCSRDNTKDVLDRIADTYGLRVFHQEKNKGKGAALHRGFQEATGDVLLVQDADLEYSPDEYPLLLKPILDGDADVVYGSRFISYKPPPFFFFFLLFSQ